MKNQLKEKKNFLGDVLLFFFFLTYLVYETFSSKVVTNMSITERYYQLSGEWCVTHFPEKPSGFGVLLIGDNNSYVEPKASFWLEHFGRVRVLEALRDEGYTIFSSNLFGRHWGNKYAYQLAASQYLHVMRHEILNKKIHIIAEGVGALVAFELMKRQAENIRSVVLITPCLHLNEYIHQEQQNKFFYKRLMNELQVAYELSEEKIWNVTKAKTFLQDDTHIPVKIYTTTNGYEKELCTLYKLQKENNYGIMELSYYVKERKYDIGPSLSAFLKKFETEL